MINNKFMFLLIILVAVVTVQAQDIATTSSAAMVSFISSQHTYLKLESNNGLAVNDTLFIEAEGKLKAAFIVNYLSKSSCAALNLLETNYKANDKLKVYWRKPINDDVIISSDSKLPTIDNPENIENETSSSNQESAIIDGRLSISSYSNLSATSDVKSFQRWRYSLSFDALNIMNSNLSFESYINFAYRADRWNTPGENIWDKLKIYSLSLSYEINDDYNISFGRKINNKFSSIGAVDGLQLEAHYNLFDVGVVAGTRPDYNNFSISTDYMQYGVYLARIDTLLNSRVENSISLFQISKASKIDRRFMYFQHSNNIIPDLFLFVSGEVDLYKRLKGIDQNAFELTNLYFSGRYSPVRWMSLTTSYDIRKNVMYYETYKNIADSLFDVETRQGFRTRINIKPFKYASLSLQYGTRSKIGDKRKSNNYGATINYSKVPYLDASTSLSFSRLNTSYVNANMYGITLNKYFWDGFINANLGYRRLEYKYLNNTFALNQNLIQLDAGIRIFGKDYLSINVESNIDQSYTGSRIYLNFTKRF